MFVSRLLRCCCISGFVHWQCKWLRESVCWLQRGQRGKSSCCESALGVGVEYLCLLYMLGSAL